MTSEEDQFPVLPSQKNPVPNPVMYTTAFLVYRNFLQESSMICSKQCPCLPYLL